ncbi:hypothetical protein V5N11_019031 [Cardamine amara subsp. amara]|uniref:Retrotransposon gag domain-containing protein n=1 Tax=Cardamine amara subsp. amara TaxID=228776 RepID=A0ABD0ZAW6_CARAN
MEDQNQNQEDLDDPPPQNCDQGVAGPALVLQRKQEPHVTLGDYNAPSTFYENHFAICPLPIDIQDYEISTKLIKLIKENQFHGDASEIPMDHIEDFEEMCGLKYSIGIPAVYVKYKLFSFSLGDEARLWLRSLPPGSLKPWDEIKTALLKQFYTHSRTNSIRDKIYGFKQEVGEFSMKLGSNTMSTFGTALTMVLRRSLS